MTLIIVTLATYFLLITQPTISRNPEFGYAADLFVAVAVMLSIGMCWLEAFFEDFDLESDHGHSD